MESTNMYWKVFCTHQVHNLAYLYKLPFASLIRTQLLFSKPELSYRIFRSTIRHRGSSSIRIDGRHMQMVEVEPCVSLCWILWDPERQVFVWAFLAALSIPHWFLLLCWCRRKLCLKSRQRAQVSAVEASGRWPSALKLGSGPDSWRPDPLRLNCQKELRELSRGLGTMEGRMDGCRPHIWSIHGRADEVHASSPSSAAAAAQL